MYTILVPLKNITLSAEDSLIMEARAEARARRSTLNHLFREWLAELVGRRERERRLAELMKRLGDVRAGNSFSREEMNER